MAEILFSLTEPSHEIADTANKAKDTALTATMHAIIMLITLHGKHEENTGSKRQ